MGYPSCRRSGSLTRSPIWRAAAKAGVKTEIDTFPLAEADAALARPRGGELRGAAVLVP
jgi:D-arabinose 1-dehydrogenase-like Zn-dependent alcohol dehydrogenase